MSQQPMSDLADQVHTVLAELNDVLADLTGSVPGPPEPPRRPVTDEAPPLPDEEDPR